MTLFLNFKAKIRRSELLFYIVFVAALFIKFWFAELEISSCVARWPLSVASSLGFFCAAAALLMLVHFRVRKYFVFVWDFALTALAITDLLYMRFYSDLFSFINLGLSAQVGDVSDSVFALFSFTDILYFVDFPLLIWLSSRTEFKRVTARRVLAVVLIAFVGFSCVWLRLACYKKSVPGVLNTMWDKPAVCNAIGTVAYHVNDVKNILKDVCFKEKITHDEIIKIKNWLEKRAADQHSEINFGVAKGANLIVIQVESLQNFVINRRFNGVEITPNLNRFIRESYYLDHIYNQTAAGNSADAEFLANAGFYPASSGVAYMRFAGNDFEAMPKVLADNGYDTLALHGDKPGFWNRQAMYPQLGFKRFVSKNELDASEIIGLGISDRSFFKQTADILAQNKQPFYAFLVTITSHYPFGWEKMLQQADFNAGEFNGSLLGNYLSSMKYFDIQFGKFIADIKKKGLLDKSVVVVYGDHTAIPQWDKGDLSKLLKKDLSSSTAWCAEQTVPLIIRTPGAGLRGRGYQAGGLLDVSKTVMTILGIDYKYTLGRNLFDGSKKEPVIFKTGSYVYDVNFVEPSIREAHNLYTGKQLYYADFAEITREAKMQHNYSNMLLEHNLLKKFKNLEK